MLSNSSDILFNPIGKLVDKVYYNSLDELEKQHYILTLCDKYNEVREKYLECEKIS